MAMSIQPRKKHKKTQNGLRKDLFTRLQLVNTFEDYPSQLTDVSSSLTDSYLPRVLGSCTLAWRLPKNPLDVKAYRDCIISPGDTPYFNPPPLPSFLPAHSRNSRIAKPIHSSLLPLLMTAHQAGVDVRQYSVVSERNSFRKLAMNNEDFVITVVLFDSTLFLRRYANYRGINRNDPGYRFEEMCTTTIYDLKGDYHQLIEGQIGDLRILMLGETDAIRRGNGESIELKCHRPNPSKSLQHDWWSQAFLSGTNTIVHGRYSITGQSEIEHLKEYRISELTNEQMKMKAFQRLHQFLHFLLSNVAEGRMYMLRRHQNNTTKEKIVCLYEVVDETDKRDLTFITGNILRQLGVNN